MFGFLQEIVRRGGFDFSPLGSIEESVYIQNPTGVLVYANEAHQKLFSGASPPLGRTKEAFLDATVAAADRLLSDLILSGSEYVECEHTGPGPDGAVYRMHSWRCSLQRLNAPGLAILGITRLLEKDRDGALSQQLDLAASFAKFRDLAERDQEICRLTALGVSSRELGDRLGMTTRGIELRKQKAFAQLGVAKAVDLARLLTRLHDRGFVDLGL